MRGNSTEKLRTLVSFARGALTPPPGRRRVMIAFGYGALCHSIFAVAVLSMVIAMSFGMSEGFGRIAEPWSLFANAFLLLQFPALHSFLLSRSGGWVLSRLAPSGHGRTLSTTSYAIIASAQLCALFLLWTPSGVVWWRAEGALFAVLCCLYGLSWLLLLKASFDAGAEVQSGALGWMSMAADRRPVFPDMPTTGLFRIIRQPIYVAFALTLWTVPVWTPDQLAVASTLTAYCLLAPLMKERRFEARYGARFRNYRAQVPYAFPSFTRTSPRE